MYRRLANGQNIDYSGKNGSRSSSALSLGLKTTIFKNVNEYISRVSDNRTIGPLVLILQGYTNN